MPVELNLTDTAVILESSSEPGPAGPGVATGGTVGQVLTKDSSTDFDTSWQDATGGGGGSAAEDITFTPAGTIAATDTQAAVEEVASDAASALTTHSADTTGVHGITNTANLSVVGHAHAGEDITSGIVADARIASTIARDSEVTSAISAHEADTTSVHGITDTSALALTANVVTKALYDANTVLAATTDDTPAAVTMGASTILARLAAGNIKAASVAEIITLLAAYTVGGTDVSLADGGTGASLTDPNADRIMFWDDSAGSVAFLTAGTGLTITGTTIDAAGGAGSAIHDAYALLQDQKAAGTQSGTFNSGSFQTRTLNTEVFDPDGIVTLSSNQFTLAAGTYLIKAITPTFGVDRHQCKIRNITDSTDAIIGASAYAPVGNAGTSPSTLTGRITIAGSKTFELQHRCETGRANQGFGVEANLGVIEVYAEVEIWREA